MLSILNQQPELGEAPVVVIGCGPVGLHFAKNWRLFRPQQAVVMFGAEKYQPYDRIRLGSLLQEKALVGLSEELSLSLPEASSLFEMHLNQRVTQIDPDSKTIQTDSGLTQSYHYLVLATGATSFVPPIEGIEYEGVHTLRTADDAFSIQRELHGAQDIIILGGGLLGVETAMILASQKRQMHLIERKAHLLAECDEQTRLETEQVLLQQPNLQIYVSSGIKRIYGDDRITAVELIDGGKLSCDLLIISAGVRANTTLAEKSGLETHRGIVVDAQLKTSIPDIFAIGDCAEFQVQVHGVLATGFRQAEVLAQHLNGENVNYQMPKIHAVPKIPSVYTNAQAPIATWPQDKVVCHCNGVTCGEIRSVIRGGCKDMDTLCSRTQAGTNCGSCRSLVSELLGTATTNRREKILQVVALLTIFISVLYLILPGLAYQDNIVADIKWDSLWRDNLSRQISGFSLVTISIMISVIAIRKRLRRFRWGEFSSWRNSHVILGLLIVATLLLHTGARLGDNLNQALMLCFIGVLISGGLLGGSIANEHYFTPRQARRLRITSLWLHLSLLLPLPALLIFHILKSYYF